MSSTGLPVCAAASHVPAGGGPPPGAPLPRSAAAARLGWVRPASGGLPAPARSSQRNTRHGDSDCALGSPTRPRRAPHRQHRDRLSPIQSQPESSANLVMGSLFRSAVRWCAPPCLRSRARHSSGRCGSSCSAGSTYAARPSDWIGNARRLVTRRTAYRLFTAGRIIPLTAPDLFAAGRLRWRASPLDRVRPACAVGARGVLPGGRGSPAVRTRMATSARPTSGLTGN